MKRQFFVPSDARGAGIEVQFRPTDCRINISGWYDTMVGIEAGYFTLAEFFEKLGITKLDCEKAFSQ